MVEHALRNGRDYWYALVAAAPRPEDGERANVAVVFGNGVAVHLKYLPHLPRLCGLAARDEANVYEAVLKHASDSIGRGMAIEHVRALLSPQLIVTEPRPLYRDLTDSLIDRVAHRYLDAPPKGAESAHVRALIRESRSQLDFDLDRAFVPGVTIEQGKGPRDLYGKSVARHTPFRIARVSRVLRGMSRDVLVDSLIVGDATDASSLQLVASRIARAFWVYDAKLREPIRRLENRQIQIVGVLQPAKTSTTKFARGMREFIRETWAHNASVIDGSEVDVVAELRGAFEWAGTE